MQHERIDIQLEMDAALEQSRHESDGARCVNKAPVIAIKDASGTFWSLVQGCCNSWTCPRCGHIRARQEYARMVEGSRQLSEAGKPLYFMTFTCRGGNMTVDEAEKGYPEWTNRLLTALRKDAKLNGIEWCYVGVTERQRRGHPHSHHLITYCPTDAKPYKAGMFMPGGRRARQGSLYSAYLIKRAVESGLGSQTDVTQVRSAVAVANYISKYLFKDALTTEFPKGWRRIRYSRNFPKLVIPVREGFPVIRHSDWMRVRELSEQVITRDYEVLERAYAHIVTNVRYIDSSAK